LETIAEGIETQEQRDRLFALGCSEGQGYLFSQPLTSDLFQALLIGEQSR